MLRIIPDEYYVLRINKRYVRKFRKLLTAFIILSLPVIINVLPPGKIHTDSSLFSLSFLFLFFFPLFCAVLSHRESNALPQPSLELCEKLTLICTIGQVLSVLMTSICFGTIWMGSGILLPISTLCQFQVGFTTILFIAEVLADGLSNELLRAFYFYNTSAILSIDVLLSEMAQVNPESLLKEIWLHCLIFIGSGIVLSIITFFVLLNRRYVNKRVHILGRYA